MHGSAPWKSEETIVGLPRLLVLSVFSRFGGCHLSGPPIRGIGILVGEDQGGRAGILLQRTSLIDPTDCEKGHR